MLSSDPILPRPRPPAKIRKSMSLQTIKKELRSQDDYSNSPPPYNSQELPYAPSLPAVLGSPPGETHTLQLFSPIQEQPPSEIDWLNESSGAEIEKLLSKVEGIIGERDAEYDLRNAIGRTLRKNNALLRSKHDALSTPESTPDSESSPGPYFAPLHKASPSTSTSATWSSHSNQLPQYYDPSVAHGTPQRWRHARNASTASELAALADQNAELLDKLTDLESESARAEQAGKRKLQALEREIALLREELDKTRQRTEKFEEEMKESRGVGSPAATGLGIDFQEDLAKLMKKLDREAKIKALRKSTQTKGADEQGLSEPKDFAPGSAPCSPDKIFTTPSKSRISRPILFTPAPSASTSDASEPQEQRGEDGLLHPDIHVEKNYLTVEELISSAAASPAISSGTMAPSCSISSQMHEFALVSTLLLKIKELEEMNIHLSSQQLDTRIRLRRAEREAEMVRRVYEEMHGEQGEFEMEVVEDGSMTSDKGKGPKTIKLRSVSRRTSSILDTPADNPEPPSTPANVAAFDSQEFPSHSTMSDMSMSQEIDLDMSASSELARALAADKENDDDPFASTRDSLQGKRKRQFVPKSRKALRGLFDASENQADSGSPQPLLGLGVTMPIEGDSLPKRLRPKENIRRPLEDLAFPKITPAESQDDMLSAPTPVLSISPCTPPSIVHASSHFMDTPALQPAFKPLSSERSAVSQGYNDDVTTQSLGNELGATHLSGMRIRTFSINELLDEAGRSPIPSPVDAEFPTNQVTPRKPATSDKDKSQIRPDADAVVPSDTPAPSKPLSQVIDTPKTPSSPQKSNRMRSTIKKRSSMRFRSIRSRGSIVTPVASQSSKAVTELSDCSHSEEAIEKKPKSNLPNLVMELWLWLQFVVVVAIFVFTVARQGPKGILEQRSAAKRRASRA